MIPGTDLHQFDVHNDGYFAHLPLTFQGLYYQVPSQELERGLVRVSDDRSTSYMFNVEETFGRLTLYLDHLDMNLSEYLSQAITYDMDDLVSKKIGPPKRGVEARTSTKDKGKEKVSEDASDVVETRRCTVEVDSETKYESDDSDYQSDKSVDYLSPGKDELIKLRNRMKATRKAKAKAKDKLNLKMNEPNEENSMPADNVRDGIIEDPFIYVEKHVERYPMYDETTHWRLRKPEVKAYEI
ncbi:hypothetical protein Tco_0328548 [Tanacetum coccineum]